MQRHFAYPVALTADEVDGGFVANCRDIPEAITQGDSLEEVLEAAEGALEAAVEMRMEDGLDIPLPSEIREGEHPVSLPVGSSMKAAVYLAMREQGLSKSELARRLDLDEKEARRILDPRHATKVPTLERVLCALGKRVEVVVY
ncbi:MAG: type II toxin-antitoxin system HicB family antitoxin [Gammaproteobacteria bacterium]|nr:type II toxin-antitoxin system HicB family antitoxin [Gammaproteobacteria bacterium]MBU1655009.1 type II toxin-antitoxin system HicB family antitoxin [Gammaproteobacteria bacterium]MBU1960030.1 type II toxin-antitoxin system HicB family antitoxin [Gammaproteobacteria bacterium]